MARVLRSGSPALRQGLIFGVILAVVEIAYGFISSFLGSSLLVLLVSLAIFLVIGFLAGRRASMQTGRISTGVLAGFLAGLIGVLIAGLIGLVFDLFNLDSLRQQLQQSASQQHLHITYTNADVVQTIIFALVFNVILSSLLTLAGGALGGYFGKGRATLPPPEEYQESMFVPPTPEPTPEPTPTAAPPENEQPEA